MLTRLTIENYALINKSVIDFKDGFTVITGETGAGKSIMLDALTLLLGARTGTKAMGDKNKKTIVEAVFANPNISLKEICESNGIDFSHNEMIIRREISPAGKSRGFVNDTPVNLATLALISGLLIDIHSQHSNNLLQSSHLQLAIIDAFGNTAEYLKNYQITFRKYIALRNKIKDIKDAIAHGKENKEFILFRLEQLEKLKPRRGELAVLEREAEILGDADRIKSDLSEAMLLLENGSDSVLRQIQSIASIFDSVDLNLFDPQGKDNILERIESIKIELRDIADTLEGYGEKINSDPTKLEKIQLRIEAIYEAMKRFKVKDESELVDLYLKLKEELKALDGNDEDISELELELKQLARKLKGEAEKLSEIRMEAAERFSNVLKEKIKPLGLPNVNFVVDISKGKLNQEGQDVVTFECSFNKNHPLQPIGEIASGGEIARVMLGIKSLISEHIQLPTVIFDEIDTGVSGEIAHKMGIMMRQMAQSMQVMAVTHLPQVASNGNFHLKVYKSDENEKTVSHIRELTPEERINEIAGMLSGNSINEVALENARILLQSV